MPIFILIAIAIIIALRPDHLISIEIVAAAVVLGLIARRFSIFRCRRRFAHCGRGVRQRCEDSTKNSNESKQNVINTETG